MSNVVTFYGYGDCGDIMMYLKTIIQTTLVTLNDRYKDGLMAMSSGLPGSRATISLQSRLQ